jgi:hypothetical protein
MAMMALDPTIQFPGVPSAPVSPTSAAAPKPIRPSSAPSIAHPSKGSIGAFIASILSAIFKRK